MKREIDPDVARKTFQTKILDTLYVLTGCRYSDEKIVDRLEQQLLVYIANIKDEARRILTSEGENGVKRRGRKRTRPTSEPPITLQHIFQILQGTPEFYGAKRCIILKQYSRKVEKLDDSLSDVDDEAPSDVEVDDVEEKKTDEATEAEQWSELQKQLAELDDGTEVYKKFEKNRLDGMLHADRLTLSMTREEYEDEYSRISSIKFIKKKDHFCIWADFLPRPNDFVFIVLSWLCTNKLRTLVRSAFQKMSIDHPQRQPCIGLFARNHIDIQRTEPIPVKYFVDDEAFLQASEKELQEIFLLFNKKFTPPTRQQTKLEQLLPALKKRDEARKQMLQRMQMERKRQEELQGFHELQRTLYMQQMMNMGAPAGTEVNDSSQFTVTFTSV
jgi:hypothetical protein